MIMYHSASSALSLLLLLRGTVFLHLSSSYPLSGPGESPQSTTPPGLVISGDGEKGNDVKRSVGKEKAEAEEEHEDELFKDVDPKTLAAVLVEALKNREDEEKTKTGEIKKYKASREVKEETERDRDGRQELELLMAAQGKEQEKEEAEKRRTAEEEEEKMTEKVTSRTTSQTILVQTQQRPAKPDGGEGQGQGGASQQGAPGPEAGSNEEEEQLNPEELKNLETMMKEFPRLNTFAKREGDSEQNERESRGFSSYNDIIPVNKGNNPSMSKKKLKWQEETQKAMNFPTFTGGNFMNDFEDSNYVGGNTMNTEPQTEQVMDEHQPEEDEEEAEGEEVLSPEEEEARAKAEQEEMRRQAAEAQRAKMEEEKLADIASDMLLRYMVKQNNGNKKYRLSLSNGAEDKRSNEEQEVTEEDDIDPQTIDKLIEISSKLHLPADDVVDIISDVEKKKKKDVAPELTSRWQWPLMPPSESSSTNGFSVSKTKNGFSSSKQLSPTANRLKAWFHDKAPTNSQDLWNTPAKFNPNPWPKVQKPVDQDVWFKSPMSVWTGYAAYPFTYPSYYQRKPYPGYYPIHFPPPTRPKPRYYIPKPVPAFNGFLGNGFHDTYTFPPRRHYHNWIQPRLRKPPAVLQHKPYYSNYPLPRYSQTFEALPPPKARSPLRVPPQRQQFYFSASAPAVRQEDLMNGNQPEISNSRDDLQKYLQQILMKQVHMLE